VLTAASCKLVEGAGPIRTSTLAKPGYLQTVIEPDFGTTITRITGDPGSPMPVVGGTWGTLVYGNYPKDAAWNADQSLLLLKHSGNSQAPFLFLDGTTYQVSFGRRGTNAIDTRWHPTIPDVMITVGADGSVFHWNVRTNTNTVKFRPSGYTGASFGSYEGNPSRDGRYVTVQATRSSDLHVVAFTVDVDGGSKSADIDLTAANISSLDWVSLSEAGGFVVAYGTIDGRAQRTKVWRRDGTPVGYWQDYTFGHYDLGLDGAGNEVAFGAVGQAPYAHHFIARRLDTGTITDLSGPITSFNWHASTRSTARPGWGYAATNDRTGFPLDGEIYAVKLDGSLSIERYAHHRANNVDYDSAPFPTPSPDGRRVLFASNWGDASGRPVQAYVADTRQLCPNGLPQ
jgi:WD40 repeat protein